MPIGNVMESKNKSLSVEKSKQGIGGNFPKVTQRSWGLGSRKYTTVSDTHLRSLYLIPIRYACFRLLLLENSFIILEIYWNIPMERKQATKAHSWDFQISKPHQFCKLCMNIDLARMNYADIRIICCITDVFGGCWYLSYI